MDRLAWLLAEVIQDKHHIARKEEQTGLAAKVGKRSGFLAGMFLTAFGYLTFAVTFTRRTTHAMSSTVTAIPDTTATAGRSH